VAGKTPAIHFFSQEGMEPGDFLSIVSVRGVEPISGDVYPLLGDGLLACEGETGLMRLLVLSGPDSDQVISDDVVVDDCGRDIVIGPDGLVYYSNDAEIRRLVPLPTE
jgi:hypothetical protein